MHQYKIEIPEDHHPVPVTMTFFSEINSTAAFYYVHPEEKEDTPYNIEVNIWQPRIEKCEHKKKTEFYFLYLLRLS